MLQLFEKEGFLFLIPHPKKNLYGLFGEFSSMIFADTSGFSMSVTTVYILPAWVL